MIFSPQGPPMTRHVQKIRTKALVYPIKLIDSDVNVDVLLQDGLVLSDPYSGPIPAGTTATYAYNGT